MTRIYLSQLKPKEVATFNYCRIYLGINKLSDLITTDGTRVQQHVWNGRRLSHRIESIIWPAQPKPKTSAWTTFKRILRTLFHTNETGVLTTPIIVEGWVRRHWKWFYCQDTARLYEATAHNIGTVRLAVHNGSRRARRSTNIFWKHSQTTEAIPEDSFPVTVYENHGFVNIDNITKLSNFISQVQYVRWSDFLMVQRNLISIPSTKPF